MVGEAFTRLLRAPPVSGWLALVVALSAVWIPSIIRLSLNGELTGCEFTPYLPFVLVCAILLRWWVAAAMAIASVGVLGGLCSSASRFGLDCFLSSAAIFLASSAAVIGTAILIRSAFAALQCRRSDEPAEGVIFSLEKGEVWASWNGLSAPTLLGSQRRVSEMMKDFLDQEELGKRLSAK
jgi:hypothetical protein